MRGYERALTTTELPRAKALDPSWEHGAGEVREERF